MNVLICTDFSEAADIILHEAKTFLKPLSPSHITVYTVTNATSVSSGQFYSSEMSDIQHQENSELKKKAEAAFGEDKIKFVSDFGIPADKIIERAKKINCDLLIIGTHGRSGLNHLMLGSVAEQVLRKINCNTLVIPIKHKSKA